MEIFAQQQWFSLPYLGRKPGHWFLRWFACTVKVRFCECVDNGYLIRSCRLMTDAVPSTPRSRRRQASRLERELENDERQRRVPVSTLFLVRSWPPF